MDEHITAGVVGGPSFATAMRVAGSGYEGRSIAWNTPLRKWKLPGHIIESQNKMQYLISFFMLRSGPAYSWLFKDWEDYTVSANGEGDLPDGDGATVNFQLTKYYVESILPITRLITKPRSGTVRIYTDTVLKTEGVDYTINYLTGLLTFAFAPGSGIKTYWVGEFYYQTRFDIDIPQIRLDTTILGEWPDIPIMEVRE